MIWLSVDPGKVTGLAHWDGDRLLSVETLRPATAREAKHRPAMERADMLWSSSGLYATRHVACTSLLRGLGSVIVEEAMGSAAKSATQLAFRRGYIAAVAESLGVTYHEVNTSAWRRVAGETWGCSFPSDSVACKALSIALVQEHYGVTCTDDEADAVLVGNYAIRTRTVATVIAPPSRAH